MESRETENLFVSMTPVQHVREIVRQVDSIVRRVSGDPSFRVRLFGSWAVGNARPHSDIDIAIDGPQALDPSHMADIRDECDRLPTLFTIDLVDLASGPEAFRESVRERALAVEIL